MPLGPDCIHSSADIWKAELHRQQWGAVAYHAGLPYALEGQPAPQHPATFMTSDGACTPSCSAVDMYSLSWAQQSGPTWDTWLTDILKRWEGPRRVASLPASVSLQKRKGKLNTLSQVPCRRAIQWYL